MIIEIYLIKTLLEENLIGKTLVKGKKSRIFI